MSIHHVGGTAFDVLEGVRLHDAILMVAKNDETRAALVAAFDYAAWCMGISLMWHENPFGASVEDMAPE